MPLWINRQSAVHKGSQGVLHTVSINYTGPNNTPVAYANIAYSADAENTAKSVHHNGHGLCHQASTFSKSTGDELGTGGGIYSHSINGKAHFIHGLNGVHIEGKPAVATGSLMVSNNHNTMPAPLIQAVKLSPNNNKIEEKKEHKTNAYSLDIDTRYHLPDLNKLLR